MYTESNEMLSVATAVRLLDEGKITSTELTRRYLDEIDKNDTHIGAFITVCHSTALAQAEESDK